MRIVVIGAGFGGLAAAIRLCARGHDVELVEKRTQAGGRAGVFRKDGFTFDAGPTIITAPQLIAELFQLAGRRMDDFIRLVPVDPFYRVRFDDGTSIDWSGDEEQRVAEIGRLSPGDVDGYRRFARRARDIFDQAFPLIDQPFLSIGPMLRAIPRLIRARSWSSVAELVDSEVRDPRIRQLLSFHPLLIGGNPFDSPSIYVLIHELERRWGVWFAEGGTGALVAALVRVLEEMGGRVRLGAEVVSIEVGAAQRATAVILAGGERIPSDAVVCNGDVVRSYRDLVPPQARRVNSDRRLDRYRQSMSLFVLYFGTNRRYEHVAHHEILLGPRYRGLLDDVFHHERLADDFSLYLHRPTATDPSLAPPGCDAWYALSPVPNLSADIDWAKAGNAYRDRIVRHLEQRLLPDLTSHIVTEMRVDPRYFRDELNSHLGSAFSLQPLFRQSAWFRPHPRCEDIANLFFVGAGTHPGAGIPGVLSSARIVERLVDGGRMSGVG
ncbi:MAG TPA: phytoene desaturase family protein [Gemmatimonadaceae bacterium]